MMISQHVSPATNTGIEAIAHWCTPDGLRIQYGDPRTVLNIAVKASFDPNPAGHGGVGRVLFTIVQNGTTTTYKSVFGRAIHKPNYEVCTSALPGVREGELAPISAWGFDLDLSTLAPGEVVITPTIYAVSGKSTVMDSITIYNDTDGVDRRPQPNSKYVHATLGSDTGSGSLSDPCKTITQALIKGIPNASSTADSARDVGGLIIYVMSDLTDVGGDTTPGWWTSGKNFLRIEATSGRKTYRRHASGIFTAPYDLISGGGYNGHDIRVEFVGFHIEGMGFVVDKQPGQVAITREINCTSGSKYWDPTLNMPHVNYAADNGDPVGMTDDGGIREAWAVHRFGSSVGYSGYSAIHDFRLTNILGVALQTNKSSFVFSNGLVEGTRYKPGEVAGYTDTSHNFTVKGGVNLTVSIPVAGTMRIAANNGTPPDFSAQLAHIAGAKGHTYGVDLSGFTSSGNNVLAAVTATGYTSTGRPYIEVANPSAVAEVGGATARIQTANLSTGYPYNYIHPDVWQSQHATDGATISNVRAMNCRNTRSFVSSGQTVNRLVMEDCADGCSETSPEYMEWDMAGCVTFTNSIIRNCSISSPAISWGTGTDWTGTSLIDNVFEVGHATDFPNGYNRGNHFVTGTPHGIDYTTGPWFASDPSVPPYSIEPLVANTRKGSGIFKQDPRWEIDGARPTIADWVVR